jgi:hypothetical protein
VTATENHLLRNLHVCVSRVCCSRKLQMHSRDLLGSLAPEGGAFLMIGFSAFLDFTMFVSITGAALSAALPRERLLQLG